MVTMLVIRCDRCEAVAEKRMVPNLPEAGAAHLFRAVGWDVDAKCRHALCPGCCDHARGTRGAAKKHGTEEVDKRRH
jgi:hypothetical protein